MSVRMRVNRSATGNRRSHHKLTKPAMTRDSGGLALRHRVSPVTGTYKGKQVINVGKASKVKKTEATAEVKPKSSKKTK